MTGSHEVRGSIPLGSTNRRTMHDEIRRGFVRKRNLFAQSETFARARAYLNGQAIALKWTEVSPVILVASLISVASLIQGDDHA